VTEFDELDFPVILSQEFYDDDWALWRAWKRETGVEDVPDDFPPLKYSHAEVYWAVYRDRVEGPYLSKSSAKKAGDAD